jgi:hypothetical protein
MDNKILYTAKFTHHDFKCHRDVIGQRSRSPGQIFRRGYTPLFALPLFTLFYLYLPVIIKEKNFIKLIQ